MFEGGLRGFIDDVVNAAQCIGADTIYKINKLKNVYYGKSKNEDKL